MNSLNRRVPPLSNYVNAPESNVPAFKCFKSYFYSKQIPIFYFLCRWL